jgi:arginyl-tRNA synthetase
VGSEQRLHLRQVFKVLELMGHAWSKDCVHVDFGRIQGMSTRKSAVVLLKDVLDEAISRVRDIITQKNPSLENKEQVARDVGIGAVVFFDLSSRRVKDVKFDWNEILNFEGETGPYVQYSHVRLCSMLEKYGKPIERAVNFALLEQEDEFALVRMLERFPQIVVHAAHEFEPSILAGFLLSLCSTFNRYYHNHRILGDDAELTRARILLVDGLRCALKNGLRLLGLNAPGRM